MGYITYENSVSWSYYNRFEDVTNRYMPWSGEGNSFASQIVTAVNKLVYKWYNDGDVYDNRYTLKGWCNDLSSYANWLAVYTGTVELHKIQLAKTYGDYEQILKSVADLLLDEELLAVLDKKPRRGTIYECEGPFEFVELDEDEWEEEDYEEEEDEDMWKEEAYD